MPLSVSHDRRINLWGQAGRHPVVLLLFFLTAGILAGRYLPAARPWPAIFFWICAGAGLVAAARQKAAVWFFSLGILFFGWLAMARFASPVINEHHLLAHADGVTRWVVTGTVDSDPTITGNRQVFLLAVRSIEAGERQIKIDGRLRVTLYDAFDKFAFGTPLQFTSALRPIRNFANPGAFNYRNYMAYQKVFGLAYSQIDRVTVIEEAPPRTLRHAVEPLRVEIASAIENSGKGPQTGLVQALIVGKTAAVDPAAREAFTRAGVAHLLAISGLHIGIVAGVAFALFSRLFSFIPLLLWNGWVKKSAALITLGLAVAYGALAGMSPSTQRSVVMVAVFLISFVVQRNPRLMNTLALAALLILAIRPPSLFSISFQLSFSAVFFIIYGMAAVQNRINALAGRLAKTVAGFLLVSAFATAGTTPLTMYYFNQTSLAGLLSNCFLIPLVGFIAVPLGLLGALLHMVSRSAETALFAASGAVVRLSLVIAETFAALPFAFFKTVTPTIFEIICGYILLWALITLAKTRLAAPDPAWAEKNILPGVPAVAEKPRRAWSLAIALLVAALVFFFADIGYWINYRFLHKDLRVTLLDVGQGNAAVVELPLGKVFVVDGGGFAGSSTFDLGENVVAPFLWRNKIAAVDTLIATHPDTDHIGGLAYIAENFGVKQLWTNGQSVETEEYQALVDAVKRQNIAMPAYKTLAGSRTVNGVNFEIFYPPADFLDKRLTQSWRSTNNNSLVTKITLNEISFLFPGDILKKGEAELAELAGDRLASTVLISPHHGSKTSSTPALLDRVRPEMAVISAGWHNRYGYPHPDVLDRYEAARVRIYRTDLHGAVIMRTDGHLLSVETPCAQ